jgi:hypothetical protein
MVRKPYAKFLNFIYKKHGEIKSRRRWKNTRRAEHFLKLLFYFLWVKSVVLYMLANKKITVPYAVKANSNCCLSKPHRSVTAQPVYTRQTNKVNSALNISRILSFLLHERLLIFDKSLFCVPH